MRTSIATVCLSGTLDEKLVAAREAGFDGAEIFEPDLVASPDSPEAIRARGFSSDCPSTCTSPSAISRESVLTCSSRICVGRRRNSADESSRHRHPAAVQQRRDRPQRGRAARCRPASRVGRSRRAIGVRVAYEALAWGRFVDSYEVAARIVRLADHDRIGVCLDSFHILSKGHNPEAIETIPADRIFFVQLADAPLLSMDVLSWSRHHRLFPGEGGFDLGAFMGHLIRTGYDGPISLEIFNDTFRQSDPLATAIDARRRFDGSRMKPPVAGRSAGGRAARMSVSRLPDVAVARRRQLRGAAHGGDRRHAVAARPARLRRARLAPVQERRTLVAGRRAHRPRVARGPIVRSRPLPASASRSAITTWRCGARRSSSHRGSIATKARGDEQLVGVRAPDGSEVFFGASGDSEPAG